MSGSGKRTVLYFTSDVAGARWRGIQATLLLALVLLLCWTLGELPEEARTLGLFGCLAEDGFHREQFTRGAAAVSSLFGCLLLSVWFVITSHNFHRMFEGWPQGSVRRLPFHRVLWLTSLALCLSYFPLDWLGIPTGILLLLFLNRARRGGETRVSISYLSELLWQVRFCWLTSILWSGFTTDSIRTFSDSDQWLAIILIVLSFVVQPMPRLSFAFCFFVAKLTPQVVLERHLWVARIQRSTLLFGLGLSLLWNHDFVFRILYPLTLYSLGRWFYFLALAEALKLPVASWRRAGGSEYGPFVDRKKAVLPDLVSLDDHHGPRDLSRVPLDRVGDGELSAPREETPRCVSELKGRIPLEAVAAISLLLVAIGVTVARGPNWSRLGSLNHPLVRSTEIGERTVLLVPDNLPGLQRLFSHYPQIAVHNPWDQNFGLILLGALLLCLMSRWAGPVLGMWGMKERASHKPLRALSLATIATLVLGALLGWFWLSWQVGFLTFFLAYWGSRAKRSFDGKRWHVLWCDLKQASTPESPKSEPAPGAPKTFDEALESVKDYLKVVPLSLEFGSAVVPVLKALEDDTQLFVETGLREKVRNALGIEMPPVTLRWSPALHPEEWVIKMKDVPLERGRLPYNLKSERLGYMPYQTRQFLAERFLATVGPHLTEFLSSERLLDIQTRAWQLDHRSMSAALQKFPLIRISQVLLGILGKGFPVGDIESWLRPLAKLQTDSIDEAIEHVVRSLVAQGVTPLPWLVSEKPSHPLGQESQDRR